MASSNLASRIREWLRAVGTPPMPLPVVTADGSCVSAVVETEDDGGVGSSERRVSSRRQRSVGGGERTQLPRFLHDQMSNEQSALHHLPDEIWVHHVLTSMDPKSICHFSRTCRDGHRLANDDHLWLSMCEPLVIERLPGATWKFSFINWDSWTALHGTWDLLWGGKKNRGVFTFTELCSAKRACSTAIGGTVRNIRAHIVCGRSVLSFEMHHASTQRVFTYVVERMARSDVDRTVVKTAALRFDRGLARDVFAVQVLRHNDGNWYSGYLVRHTDDENGALTADALDKRYCAHVDLRAFFGAPPTHSQ